jgi:hypothetical protein
MWNHSVAPTRLILFTRKINTTFYFIIKSVYLLQQGQLQCSMELIRQIALGQNLVDQHIVLADTHKHRRQINLCMLLSTNANWTIRNSKLSPFSQTRVESMSRARCRSQKELPLVSSVVYLSSRYSVLGTCAISVL